LSVTGGPSMRTLRRMLPVALPALGRLVWTMLRPEQSRVRFQQDLETRLAEVEAAFATRTTFAGRVDLVEELIAGAFVFALPRFIPRFGAGMATLNMLIHMARQVPGGEQLALIATRGLPHNETTQMDLALWDTARPIQQDPASLAQFQDREPEALAAAYLAGSLPQPAQATVASFLERYGMRGVGEIDLGRPRWRENPVPVMQTLQSYLRIEDPEQAPDAVFRRGQVSAGAAIDRLAEEARRTHGGRLKAWRVRWAARRMRALAGLRESPKFWAVRVMGLVRAALLDSGRVLVEDGLLARPDDLFFLRLAELQALAAGVERDWLGLVQERRRAYAREQRRTQIPRLMLSDGQAFYEGVVVPAEGVPPTGEEGVLIGSPVSPGVVEGSVRVVLDPHDAPLAPGEIMVCPGTDPAWTPLFLVAGGLVMEVGGLMTHGSVVAREYGIPAVVGVSQATRRLHTGQRVRVDGTSGRVEVLEGENG
ncbi:MAG TPA: PEP-utilizing enzyme, partial [Anaerolineae bacterium]|nr:PEP-utilizing enzyme [Anaerolineae bacterium]